MEPLELEIRRGFNLKLDSTWHVDGPDDRRTINAPLVVGTSSRTPRKWHDHLVPLLAVQDLINLAHEGFVPAEQARVEFKIEDDGRPRDSATLWNSRLMALPRQGGVSGPKSMTEVPLFYLGHIGGVKGLRNWIRLDHNTASDGPDYEHIPVRETGVEVHLIELAVGWSTGPASTKSTQAGLGANASERGKKNEPLPMSIGRHVGPAFTDFVGDLDKWSQLFWDTYNSLKHAPSYEYDPRDIEVLGDTGPLLLLGALLNRVAGNRNPMKAITSSHRTQRLKQRIQKLVAAS